MDRVPLMLSLSKPTKPVVLRFLAEQGRREFSYAEVGATAHRPPAGYDVDRLRVVLGRGETTFEAARSALARWDHVRLGWVDVEPPAAPPEAGQVVAILGRAVGLWWLNACRVVYVLDELAPVPRFGFAYGTLPGHVEQGEERFLIEWDRTTDEVSYEILAFSRPRHPLARLGYPLVRLSQRRFREDSAAALRRIVHKAAASR